MIGFESDIAASSEETLAVFLQSGETSQEAPTIAALEDW